VTVGLVTAELVTDGAGTGLDQMLALVVDPEGGVADSMVTIWSA
jgi:hypothetical protein